MLQTAFLGAPLAARPAAALQRPSPTRQCTTQALFNFAKSAPAKKAPAKPKYETVVVRPSFRIPTVLLGTAAAAHFGHVDAVSWVTGILGAFLAFQANRVKFVFDDKALEVLIGPGSKESENAFVGGQNRWRYDTFVNWEFWWPAFPVLVYFKETQTKPEGQIHFFPIIMDGKQLYDVMVERCGPSQNSGPKA
ncbi:hypothetical protein C2E21_7097 [Chlorella sorokiniana]|uniref:DUF3119 family n=1 Tax=Chlorella sorokiniana TaxID=3076 RepID=A0A2P6TIS2_CHLSO|nr:hypothetical protein C2E21_7097 [Chlorella sorokiniana]|eukprot:PRW39141.1 hypothetical protein C2E21_7097 [Chlorella sorokiniana]